MELLILVVLVFVVPLSAAKVFNIPLDAAGNITLHWMPNYSSEQVNFEVHFKTASKTQWLAIGFSDYGDIKPADYCLYWVDWKGQARITDTWADDSGKIHEDDLQNCDDFKHVRHGDIIKFSFSRKFDTCDDSEDYLIEDGTTHVVWALGDGPLYRVNGLNINRATSGFQRTQLLKARVPDTDFPPDTKELHFTTDRVKVPADETTYWCHVHLLPKVLRERKHHVLQFGSAIQEGNEPLVHHMELFHCELPATQKVPNYQGPCFAKDKPPILENCKRVISAWAMGALPFAYPQEAGLPIGGPDFNPYLMLEVHYNNPQLRSDWVDNSGIKIHVSPTLRQLDAGVMELGLEYSDKMAIPPLQPSFALTGYCISECTAVGLPQDGIVIFGSQLHTHLTGIRVETRHIRDGRELPYLNQDRHYSTHFQEIRKLKRPVRILPGDALVTTCFFDTSKRQNITLGGFAITDEMCVNYVHYYPKSRLEVCKSSVSYESLWDYFRFMKEWDGQSSIQPRGAISENYESITWTPARSNVLHQMYMESPISMQCNQSSGDRFPGEWENTPLTPILYPLPPKARPACEA